MRSPYISGTSRGVASSPNLSSASARRSTSPTGMLCLMTGKGFKSDARSTHVKSDSAEGSLKMRVMMRYLYTVMQRPEEPLRWYQRADEVPPILPSMSPLRSGNPEMASVADSTRVSVGDWLRTSISGSLAVSPSLRAADRQHSVL